MTTPLTEKTFDTGEVTLQFAEGPRHDTPLVLLHGATLSRRHWDFVLDAFVDRFSVYAIDQRGHGGSGRAATGYRVVDFARDATAFLTEVVAEPAVLIGHSLGGVVAAKVSADAPSLVRAAVLIDPPLYRAQRSPGSEFQRTFTRYRELTTSDQSVEAIVTTLLDDGWPEPLAKPFGSYLADIDPAFAQLLSNEIYAGFDAGEVLEAIRCPVLLVHDGGSPQATLSGEDIRRVARHLRHCATLEFSDAGHMPHRAHRDEFVQGIDAFLGGI